MSKRNASKPSFWTSRAFLMTVAALAILITGVVIGASGVKAPTCEPAAAPTAMAVVGRG